MDMNTFREKETDFLKETIVRLQTQQEEIDRFEVKTNIKIVRLDASEMR